MNRDSSPENDETYLFRGKISQRKLGKMRQNLVWLPDEIRQQLPLDQYPRLRVMAEVNELRINGAWQPSRGRWFLLLSKKFCKLCGVGVGDEVKIEFWIADQNAIEIPDELRFALEADEKAAALWERTTIGKRRAMAHYVDGAKRAETRERRVEEMIAMLEEVAS